MDNIFMTAKQARIWSDHNNKDYDIVKKIATLFKDKIDKAIEIGSYSTYVSMDEVKNITRHSYMVNEVVHHLDKTGYIINPTYDIMERGLSGYNISWK